MNAKKILSGMLLLALLILAVSACKNPLTSIGLGSKVDILPPGIRIIPSEGVQNGAYVRGTITILGESSDDAEVASVSWMFTDSESGLSSGQAAASLDASKRSWSVELNTQQPGALYADGEKDFVFTVRDASGKTTETRMLLIFDNTAPSVNFVSPQNGATVYNQITIRGSSSDNTRLAKVELRIGKAGTGSGDGFFSVTGSLYDWRKDLLANDYANSSQSDDRGDGTWDLRIYCRAYDVAGNVATNEPSDPADPLYPSALVAVYGSAVSFDPTKVPAFALVVDLDRDKPTLTIQTPKDGSNTAGTVAVSGTCFDENPGMDKVEIQIAALRDDDSLIGYVKPDGSAVAPAASWIVVPWTGGQRSYWQQNLNENEKLYDVGAPGGAYPGETHNGRLQVSVRATDLGGKVGNVQTVKFRLDNSIPRLENPRLTLNGSDVNAVDYLYARGTIQLKAKARDDQAVTSIKISLNGGSSYGSDLIGTGYVIQNAANDFDIFYPIDTLNDAQIPPAIRTAKCGLLTIGVKIQDNAAPAPYVNTWFVTLNLDNLFPTVSYTGTSGNGHDPLALSGNKTSSSQLMGTATDSGAVSGIEKVEVYLVRGTKVVNLSTGDTLTDVESALFGEAQLSAPYTTQTDCKAVIDWSKIGAIDNMALVQNGSDVDWWAKLDTTLISDGPLDIHFVAWDRAGNAVHGTQAGFIKNKVPIISSVSVGTDLDGDGSVSGPEITTYNPASPITARNNRLYIRINTTEIGFNTPFSYSIQYAGTPTDATNYSNSSGVADINSAGKFGGDGDGKVFTVSITDLVGIMVQQNITVNIRNTDSQAPTIGVNAISSSADLLDWNGAAVAGHIESAAESLYDNAGTVDADVSGTVMVRGTAHDNVRIDAVYLSIDGGAPFQAAHWGGSGLVPDIAAFHVSAESLSDSGHQVSWDYKWDTAAIATVAKNNVVLSFTAVDSSSNPSAAGSRQYDVVPYITKVSTHSGGIKDGNIRSASGKYSILQNLVDNSDLITLSGYNLKPIANGVRVSSDPDGLAGTTLQGTALTVESSGSPWTTLTLRKNSDRSGYLVVVGGTAGTPVPSLNNVNDNTRPQNQEPDIYSQNYLLTDDRYLNFFRVSQTGYANGYYPAMVMNGDTPVFAYCNDNTGAVLRAGTVIANGWYHRMNALARDGDGNYYQVSVHDAFGNGSYGHLSLFFNAWGGNAWPLGNPGTTGNNNALALDNLTYTAVKLNRFHYPKLLVTGGSALAQVYLLYYDDEPSIKDLIVRVFRIGTSVTGTGTYAMGVTRTNQVEAVGDGTAAGRNIVAGSASMFFDAGLTSTGVLVVAYYDEVANQLRYTYNSNPVNASGLYGGSFSTPLNLDATYNGSYVSLHVDALDRIHIAYYDMADADLKYIFLENYLDATPSVARVDAYHSVGLWTRIKTNAANVPYIAYYNNSENGTRDSIKLAYYLGSLPTVHDGVDAAGRVTGYWECLTVPVRDVPQGGLPQFNQVNLGFDASGDPTVGYLADDIEYSNFLPEIP